MAIFNKHSRSITGPLNLFSWLKDTPTSSRNDTIDFIIKKFAFHRSINAIKKKFKRKSEFSFNHVCTETIKNYKWVCINEALKVGSFGNSLKSTNFRPIYKNLEQFSKKNYRSMSILPHLLKVYERVINKQALNYF